jgi:glucuronosyltransferase
MGSNLQSAQIPESKRNAFLEVFSKLKQQVLWKWETDTLPGKPKNVKLGKWLPQSDILGERFMPSFSPLFVVVWFDYGLN